MNNRDIARFVLESDLIERVDKYSLANLIEQLRSPRGHLLATLDAVRLARSHELITESDLHRWHRLIIEEELEGEPEWSPDNDLPIGRWREYNVTVGSRGGELWGLLHDVMNNFFLDLHDGIKEEYAEPLTVAASFHWRYERIHPYADGNGRTGRLIALYVSLYLNGPGFIFDNATKSGEYYPLFDLWNGAQKMTEYLRSRIVH